MSLLEHLMGRGAITIVTTHHGALKAWAYSTPGVANAAVEFDEENLRPTYRLLMGVAGPRAACRSHPGWEWRLVIEEARRKLSPATVEAEGHLRRLRELLARAEGDREEAAGSGRFWTPSAGRSARALRRRRRGGRRSSPASRPRRSRNSSGSPRRCSPRWEIAGSG